MTIKLEFTADQVRDLLAITDRTMTDACNRAAVLGNNGKATASSKTRAYADRLLAILDILEPAVAALDVKARDDASVARIVKDAC